ncbi:MAG: hypothetical protein ACO3IW_07540 [Burkholderiales bacterium]
MMRFFLIAVVVLLSGCAVTLHGNQTSGGGTTATTTGSSVQGCTRIGNARIGGSFGSRPAPNTAGGQLTLSKGASAVLLLGVVIAGTVDVVRDWLQPEPPRREPLSPDGISHTCSFYGWQPELTPAPASQ